MSTRAAQLTHADYPSAVEQYFERGWTDGLPVVPPEPRLVEAFLAAGGVEPGLVLGVVPTRDVVVTAEDAAINGVMAGCLAEYAPVVMAAVRAFLREEALPHSVSATLSGAAQAIIVNGPIRDRLGIECGQACMGPGFRANATIGRALRLVIRNVLRSTPQELDRATLSTPNRYSFCFGEDEEATGWAPLHAERGLPSGRSAVTVASTIGPVVMRPRSHLPETIIDYFVTVLAAEGTLWEHQMGSVADLPIVVAAEHQRFFCDAGWSKADIRDALWDRLSRITRQSDGAPLRLGRPDGIMIVAAGGPGDQISVALLPHVGLAVTLPIPDTSSH